MPVSYIRQKGDAIQMCLVCPERRPMRRHRQRGLKSMDLFLGQQMKMKNQTVQPTLARSLSLSLWVAAVHFSWEREVLTVWIVKVHRSVFVALELRLCPSWSHAFSMFNSAESLRG